MAFVVFGGGCFWCTEAVFRSLEGVEMVTSGYSGGVKPNPTYEEVSSGTSGYVEVVRVVFDPLKIEFKELLTVFFATHDPTTLNRQGADQGTQYASVIFYADEEQKKAAEKFIDELDQEGVFSGKIVTQLVAFSSFYEAEDYHKNYYANNKDKPYCKLVIASKIEKLYEKFEHLIKKE